MINRIKQLSFIIILAIIISCGGNTNSKQTGVKLESESGKPICCIIDMDGTIADETARRKECTDKFGEINWSQYFSSTKLDMDKPMPGSQKVLQKLDSAGVKICYLSSRPESMIYASTQWLEKNDYPKGEVYHKKEKYEKTVKYKTRKTKELQKKYEVWFGVGDRESDEESYKNAGIKYYMISEDNPGQSWNKIKNIVDKQLE